MTVKRLIEMALGLLGVLAEGEEAPPEMIVDNLDYLNAMLQEWGNTALAIPTVSRESFSLPAQQLVSIAPGGDIDTESPSSIKGIQIVDSSGLAHTVRFTTDAAIRSISLVENVTPKYYAYLPDESVPSILFSAIPLSGCLIKIQSYRPFAVFDELTAELEFHSSYDKPVYTNLAVDLAPKYGKAPRSDIIFIAKNSLDDLKNRHAAERGPDELEMPCGMPGMRQPFYDVNQG